MLTRPPSWEEIPLRVFLVHIRDPQFYAFPVEKLSRRGVPQVIGFPPIGIMSLSAVLKEAGHECVMFDQADPKTPNETILEAIREQKPELIGLSFLSTTSFPYAKVLARAIRDENPGIKIAFGGVFASLNAQLVKMQCPEVDFVCRGDGEQLILDLVDNLDTPAEVAGVTWQSADGTLQINPPRTPERELDQWPLPDRESLELDFVESMPLDVPAVLSLDRYTTMQTSRGCPWPCIFCDIPIFNDNKFRSRSPEHVLDEFERLEADGYGAVYFVDDHFLLQPKRIEAICNGIIERGITIQWGAEGRVDSVCMELFPLMAKANCRSLMFGIESGSQKILDRLKKEQTLEDIEKAVNAAKEAGIEIVHGFFVIGSPDETEEDMRATFRFASKLRIDSFGFNRLCVYRGTPLWSEYVQRGLVDDAKDWYKYYKCSEIDPTVLPGEKAHQVRTEEMRRLIIYKLTRYPLQSLRLLRRFMKHMPVKDVIYLIIKPFLGKKSGATRSEVMSRAVEHREIKDVAGSLTQLDDEEFFQAMDHEQPSEVKAAAGPN
jgi:radical SAM superfamily enzyme YgiQ (UPF0313 family)